MPFVPHRLHGGGIMRTFIAKAVVVAATLLASSLGLAFESKQGRFSAAFPAEPKVQDKVTPRGSEHWHTLAKDGQSFLVIYYEPAADVKLLSTQQLLDAEERGLLAGNRVLRKRNFEFAKNPAREFEFKTKEGVLIMARVVVTKAHVFEIMSGASASSPTAQQKAFMTSFGLAR